MNRRLNAAVPLLALVACSPQKPPAPEPVPASAAAPPPLAAAAAPTALAVEGAPAPAPSAVASGAAANDASLATSAAAPASSEPIPAVKVVNIGMHIGGGPNDAATKEPIRRSVEPHFDAFRRCWAVLDDKESPGDFGVDLRIGREGGKAQVSHPRTALKGKPFTACVVQAFEAIDFLRPKGGDTTVSYSLRFTP